MTTDQRQAPNRPTGNLTHETRRVAAAIFLATGEGASGQAISDEQARYLPHILPLDLIPLRTRALTRARLVKTVSLETMVELFDVRGGGRGLIPVEELHEAFPGERLNLIADEDKLYALEQLNSYDLFSLRLELRRLEIPIHEHEALRLSPELQSQLGAYVRQFMRPLLRAVYGDDMDVECQAVDLTRLVLTGQSREQARANLQQMADAMGLELDEIPEFLEEYGDIYLSLAYFQACLDELMPVMQRFVRWLDGITCAGPCRNDPAVRAMCHEGHANLLEIAGSITDRFAIFEQRSADLWENLSRENFRCVRRAIRDHHRSLGGVLGGLTVKMRQWLSDFPHEGGNPQRRAEFVQAAIRPGLAHLLAMERQGRTMAEGHCLKATTAARATAAEPSASVAARSG